MTTMTVNFALSSNIFGLVKIKRVRWAGRIARTHKKFYSETFIQVDYIIYLEISGNIILRSKR